MFNTNTPPQAHCRVLLTYTGGVITGEVSPLAAQQLTQQLSGLLNGEEVSHGA